MTSEDSPGQAPCWNPGITLSRLGSGTERKEAYLVCQPGVGLIAVASAAIAMMRSRPIVHASSRLLPSGERRIRVYFGHQAKEYLPSWTAEMLAAERREPEEARL